MKEEVFPDARIIGIETSCDETAAAVVENGRIVLSNVVASQAEMHAKFGGVFPEVASREHIRTIYPVVQEALQQAQLTIDDIDAIAVTRGPGLPGSLVVGLNMAKGLALSSGKPLIGINHVEAHLYSAWINPSVHEDSNSRPKFPLLALIVSGGHSELVLMEDHLTYKRLGGTLDDAAGEAFDKVARLLGLGYPGGPMIQSVSGAGNAEAYKFPRAWLQGTWDFSFSGLKTAVLHKVRNIREIQGKDPNDEKAILPVADLAASFQAAVVDVLVTKARYAAKEFKAVEMLIGGGVSANKALRDLVAKEIPAKVHIPPLKFCTDNAAMVAAAGYYRHSLGFSDGLEMDAMPNWPISEI